MTKPAESLRDLEASAARMMRELDELTKRLRAAQAGDGAESIGADAAAAIGDQLAGMQEHLKTLDQSIRKNPWLFVLGALGLGILVGKVMRR